MITPQEYKQLIDGLEQAARHLRATPGGGARGMLAVDLEKSATDVKRLSREPQPECLKPEFADKLVKDSEAQIAALDQADQAVPAVPPREAFVPWDGDAIGRQMLKQYDLLPETPEEEQERVLKELGVRPAAAPAAKEPVKQPARLQDHELVRKAAQLPAKPAAPGDFDSLQVE